mmetsp:Transcript_23723/g.67115  ORF Transcript_23723/g.67115 Transcript_23723/m.67115 type:complete len:217 (+) Transcript_23723:260-910(+)
MRAGRARGGSSSAHHVRRRQGGPHRRHAPGARTLRRRPPSASAHGWGILTLRRVLALPLWPVAHTLQKLGVGALQPGGSVLDQRGEEPRLQVVPTSDDLELHVRHTPLGPHLPQDVGDLVGDGVAPGADGFLSLRRVQLLEGGRPEEPLQQPRVDRPADPHEHRVAVLQEVDAVLGHGLAREVEHVRQDATAMLVGDATFIWTVVQRHHSRVVVRS